MSGVFFNGQLLVTPTTASQVNDDAMRNQNLSVGNVAALLGKSTGGKPKTALRFGSPTEAVAALGSGELLDAVLAAFSPSAQTNGPSSVVALRVDPATQATGSIVAAGSVAVINLTSTDYGLEQNQIKYKIEAGSVTGFRVTTQKDIAYFSKDNVHRKAFSVLYTGAEATSTITITGTSLVLAAPAGTVVSTLDLNVYPTVQDVADRINAITGFTASVLDGNYSAPALNGLDYVTAASITSTYTVRADLQAIVDYLNSTSEGFVTATRVPGVGAVPVAAPFTFLSGAINGSATNTDWSDAFTVLQSVDAQWVGVATADASIHAMADAHVAFMSTVGRKERRAICGSALGTTDLAAADLAKALNSDRTSLVHLGHYNYNASGVLTLYPPYITAALLVGMFAGVNPGTPLTNKTIRVRGLERDLRNPTDTDVLINAGVLPIENTAQGYKVVKSISTWLTTSNYNKVEQSCGVALDYVSRNVREALDVLRGTKAGPLLLSRALSITDSVLRELAREEPQGPSIIVGNAASPAYQNITASIEGDVLRVQFECSPVIPTNYVLATIFAVPFSGAATA
jgi:hypothetical protein